MFCVEGVAAEGVATGVEVKLDEGSAGVALLAVVVGVVVDGVDVEVAVEAVADESDVF